MNKIAIRSTTTEQNADVITCIPHYVLRVGSVETAHDYEVYSILVLQTSSQFRRLYGHSQSICYNPAKYLLFFPQTT